MVPGESESEADDAVQTAERQTPWVFQLLRGGGQLCQFETVFLASNADTVQMAKPTQPTAQFQLARVPGTPEALSGRTTTDCRTAKDEKGRFVGLSWIAEASILEEPGAGKPHAGICAGAVG